MKKGLILMGAAALVLSSCSQEDVLSVNNTTNNDNHISFRVRSNKSTHIKRY